MSFKCIWYINDAQCVHNILSYISLKSFTCSFNNYHTFKFQMYKTQLFRFQYKPTCNYLIKQSVHKNHNESNNPHSIYQRILSKNMSLEQITIFLSLTYLNYNNLVNLKSSMNTFFWHNVNISLMPVYTNKKCWFKFAIQKILKILNKISKWEKADIHISCLCKWSTYKYI